MLTTNNGLSTERDPFDCFKSECGLLIINEEPFLFLNRLPFLLASVRRPACTVDDKSAILKNDNV